MWATMPTRSLKIVREEVILYQSIFLQKAILVQPSHYRFDEANEFTSRNSYTWSIGAESERQAGGQSIMYNLNVCVVIAHSHRNFLSTC